MKVKIKTVDGDTFVYEAEQAEMKHMDSEIVGQFGTQVPLTMSCGTRIFTDKIVSWREVKENPESILDPMQAAAQAKADKAAKDAADAAFSARGVGAPIEQEQFVAEPEAVEEVLAEGVNVEAGDAVNSQDDNSASSNAQLDDGSLAAPEYVPEVDKVLEEVLAANEPALDMTTQPGSIIPESDRAELLELAAKD